MNLDLITTDEPLSPEVTSFINEHFKGKNPVAVINDAIESYKTFEIGMGDIYSFRSKYNKMTWVEKKWNERDLAENTNDAVLKLCQMSDAQAKMQLLVLFLTERLVRQQTILSQQQEQIREQTQRISGQQEKIEGHQEELEAQNNKLIEQQKVLEKQARQLNDDNSKLIEASAALKALRSIGQSHDNEIAKQDKALNELETFYLKLRQALSDMNEVEDSQNSKIGEIANDVKANRSSIEKIASLEEKLDEQIEKNVAEDQVRDTELERQRRKDDEHDSELERQRKKDIEHDTELERQRRKDDEHDSELARQRKKDLDHDNRLEDLTNRLVKLESKGDALWIKIAIALNLLLTLIAIILSCR